MDSIGRPTLNDHVDWVLLERATEERSSDVLLDHGDVGRTVQQRLEEAKELLVQICIDRPVVVKNGEQDRDDKLHRWSLKHQEVVILVKEDHLVKECLFLARGQLGLQVRHFQIVIALAKL